MEYKDQISESLEVQTSSGVKRDNSGNHVSRDVLMYRWKWVVGKKKSIEGELCFFSEEDCKVDASFNQPSGEKNSLFIEKVWGPPPPKCLHMQQVFLHLFHLRIEALVKEKCPGCKVNAESQKDHMGHSGCLDEKADHASLLCSEALEKILKHDLISLFEKSRQSIGANSAYSEIYAEGVLFYMTPKYVLELNQLPGDKNKPLLVLLARC